MPSSYSTDLKLELMVTGEQAGLWGDKTNTNLNLVQQAVAGYEEVDIASATTTTLAMTNATLSNARNAVIKLTGSIGEAKTVEIASGIEKMYVILNGTTGAYTVTFKVTGQTGVTWATDDKGTKLVWSNGTDIIDSALGVSTSPGGSDTQLQYNNSSAFGGATGLTTDGTNLNILSQGDLRLQDTTGGEYIAHQAAGTTVTYTVTWPAGVATEAGQALTSSTGGALSWTTLSGGTSWQAVKTTGFTAAAGEGYFCDTSSAAFTATLPAGTLGDEIVLVDYAGTFDTNNLTVAPDGSEKIQGTAASLTVSVERAAFTLVYSGTDQGWLLKDK